MDENIYKNLKAIENELQTFGTSLLPVTKTFSNEYIMAAYSAGYRQFGENRVQELIPKYEELPKDIEWHLIGHLQTNKVKYIAPWIGLIQSVDSEKLLAEINKQAGRYDRKISCLFQVYIATEETKFGWDAHELKKWLVEGNLARYPHVEIKGLMGMASFSEDKNLVRQELRSLKQLFDSINAMAIPGLDLKILSMGMSGDYLIAAEEGSTLVRMGSAIFGHR